MGPRNNIQHLCLDWEKWHRICRRLHGEGGHQHESRSYRQVQPSSLWALEASATSRGGSPGRRTPSLTDIGRPVTDAAAWIISLTEKPLPVPRLYSLAPLLLCNIFRSTC